MNDELKYIDKLVSSKLAGHAIETTGNSWLAISRIAFWRNFLIFNFARFNVYYAALILLLGVSGVFYFITPSNSLQQSNLINNTYYQPRTTDNTQQYQLVSNNNSLNLTKRQNINTLTNTNNSTVNNNSIADDNTDFTSRIKTSKSSTNRVKRKSNVVQSKSSSSIKEYVSNDIETNKSASIKNANINNQFSSKSDVSESTLNKIKRKNTIALNDDNSSENSNLIANSFSKTANNSFSETSYYGKRLSRLNMIGVDNISSDNNLFSNVLQAFPIDSVDYYLPVNERSNWMLEVYLSPLYANNMASSGNSELSSYLNKKRDIEKPVLSFTTGMNIIYQGRNNLIFQTGVAYSQLGEFISRKDITEIINGSYPLYPDGGFFNVDTIQFYNIDSLLQGIEYIETVYDSAWVDDNTIVNTSDTTIYKGANNRNKYSYFEIPVMIGYSLPYGQFNLQLKAGIITSIFINANGNKLNMANEKEIVSLGFDSPKYRQVNYSFVSGFDLSYQLSSKLDFTTGFYYRRNLFNIFEQYPYSQKHYAGEFHLGIKYHL